MRLLRDPAVITGGSIRVRGRDVLAMDSAELRSFRWSQVAMVFQSAMNALNPVITVGDQIVDIFTTHQRLSKAASRERAAELLELVRIDPDRLRSYPHQLSGGMRQRVVIAMAVALRPDLLIMDEPTTALDVVVQQEIMAQIAELQRELGFSVLFITHDMSLMIELSNRMAVMYAGRFVETAESRAMLRRAAAPLHTRAHRRVPSVDRTPRPTHGPRRGGPVHRHRGPSRRATRPLGRAGPCRFRPPGRTPMNAVPIATDARRETAGPSSDPVIGLRGLSMDFHSGGVLSRKVVRALRSVELDIFRGEIVALVGESGSGKSTIARCIARLQRPTSGSILLDGVDVLRSERRRASRSYRSKVQMVFQDPFGSLNPVHRVEHVLERAVRVHGRLRGRSEIRARLEELMTTVDLPVELLGSYPHELSGGQRQRIAIARALALEPKVILADEPTSMLDVSVRIGVLNLMRRLRDEQGISILYITHDLASARYVADRTIVMFAGELVEGGESLDLMANPAHPYTQLLLSAVPDPTRTGTFDLEERARLRAAVLDAAACPFDGDPDQECSRTDPVRHTVGDDTHRHWVRCHLYRPEADVATRALTVDAGPGE